MSAGAEVCADGGGSSGALRRNKKEKNRAPFIAFVKMEQRMRHTADMEARWKLATERARKKGREPEPLATNWKCLWGRFITPGGVPAQKRQEPLPRECAPDGDGSGTWQRLVQTFWYTSGRFGVRV